MFIHWQNVLEDTPASSLYPTWGVLHQWNRVQGATEMAQCLSSSPALGAWVRM